ncbi:Patatin-like phospholipase [Poseidonocella pacifica]|uniref:Patatin-like phospholipase n=1 Tax=Poseidonocella pacifica TaxID=871651 RepID=A0A1I0WP41_9RHOB|nr:Patatin-like phospholipase [Poseidonocella pacifica]
MPPNPEQIVFSGGGLRCFWQGGFMSVYCEACSPTPRRVTGVSGGALAGAAFLGGVERRLLDVMCDAFAGQDSNFDPFQKDGRGLTPHQTVYCEVVEQVLDASVASRIESGPSFQILIAHPPERPAPTLTGMAMTAAYEAELHIKNAPHFGWAQKIGLTSQLVDARQAAREGKLCDLVCAAAVIPPVFEPPLWEGRPVVDGGMADQAPMPDPDEGETLVLLTRDYDSLPEFPGRYYVSPEVETPADKIDFTDPDKLRATWEHGEEDARRLLTDRHRKAAQ